jgi:apolipoprotein N-acyltransferase
VRAAIRLADGRAAFAPVLALAAGGLSVCAFAPLNAWPLAVLCPMLLMALLEQASPRRAAWLGFAFGVGTFGVGTWWLFISIRGFGGAPLWLTVVLMLALVLAMAAYYALLGWAAARWLPASGAKRALAGVPALWLLIEWLRGWLLSGFPWLSLGYSQTDTPLAGFASLLGIYGLSALLLVCAGALLLALRSRGRVRLAAVVVLLLPWPIGALLVRHDWTRPAGAPVSVAIVQGAIPQDEKWQAANVEPTRLLYAALNERALGAQLIVWPEAALPQLINEPPVPEYLGRLNSRARMAGSDIAMGVIREADNGEDYFNSIMTLTDHVSFYDKRHLVPFAEYFPIPSFVRDWLRLLNLPYSDFTPGRDDQQPLTAAGLTLAPTICYEDAFAQAQRRLIAVSQVLLTVSNDAWFGHSWARYQHFQIGRLLALSADKPLLRAANDGVSALVDSHGVVIAQAPEFQAAVLKGTVQPMEGLSPYMRLGDWPILSLALVATLWAGWRWGRPGTHG